MLSVRWRRLLVVAAVSLLLLLLVVVVVFPRDNCFFYCSRKYWLLSLERQKK